MEDSVSNVTVPGQTNTIYIIVQCVAQTEVRNGTKATLYHTTRQTIPYCGPAHSDGLLECDAWSAQLLSFKRKYPTHLPEVQRR